MKWTTIDCPQCTINQIRYDYAFTLIIDGNTSLEVRIERSFIIHHHNSIKFDLKSPSKEALYLSTIGLHNVVKTISYSEAGDLKIEAESIVYDVYRSSGDYEAWQINRDDGLIVVSMPNGSVAMWGGAAD